MKEKHCPELFKLLPLHQPQIIKIAENFLQIKSFLIQQKEMDCTETLLQQKTGFYCPPKVSGYEQGLSECNHRTKMQAIQLPGSIPLTLLPNLDTALEQELEI